MRACRGAGPRADRRHPARIARRRVLHLLLHSVGVAGGHEPQRAECVDSRQAISSATAPRCAATRLAAAVPMPVPISTPSQWMAIRPSGAISTDPNEQSPPRSEEHTSELQSRPHLVCRLLLEKKKKKKKKTKNKIKKKKQKK